MSDISRPRPLPPGTLSAISRGLGGVVVVKRESFVLFHNRSPISELPEATNSDPSIKSFKTEERSPFVSAAASNK